MYSRVESLDGTIIAIDVLTVIEDKWLQLIVGFIEVKIRSKWEEMWRILE